MTNALVLSGGGAKGIFQMQAVKELLEAGITFDVISGVSVGSLNGSLLATDQFDDLEKLWLSIEEKDVFERPGIMKLLYAYAKYKMGMGEPVLSIYDTTPLKKLLSIYLGKKPTNVPFYAGRVNINTGFYESATSWFSLPDTVLASSSIPVIFQPVSSRSGEYLIDGGVRNISPISEVMKYEPDRIFIITTEPLKPPFEKHKVKDIVDIAEKTIGVMLDEIFNEDIKRFMDINHLVKQCPEKELVNRNGKRLKYFESVIIDPHISLGNGLDFSRDSLERRRKHGSVRAKRELLSIS